MSDGPTPSQTAGPFLHIGMEWADGPDVVTAGAPGALWLRGRLLDGNGDPCGDALIETWQADAQGRYPRTDGPSRGTAGGFTGFGRACTDANGAWAVRTIKPGGITAGPGAPQAPHIAVTIFARGLLRHLTTRLYFADEKEANATDPVLSGLEPADRERLLAQPTSDGYHLDIRLQGDESTVFLDF